MSRKSLLISLFAILPLLWQPAAAAGVYTWTDADGVTHFSDSPPAGGQVAETGVETIDLPAGFPEPADPEADYYSIANQWQRMQAERHKKEQLALERERVRNERRATEATARPAVPAADNSPRYVVGWGGPAYRGVPAGRRHHHRGPSRDHYRDDRRASRHLTAGRYRIGYGAGSHRIESWNRRGGLSVSVNRPGFSLRLR